MYIAVRVRGQPDVNDTVRETLDNLGLERKNQAAVLPEREELKGMLKKCKDFITFGNIGKDAAEELAEEKNEEFDPESITVLNFRPPKKGYKDTRTHYRQGGSLGERGEDIENLLKRMSKVI